MKITINNKEVDYIPDYPEGWKFSAGDPYKFPVEIAGQACFIKRFQNKSPADISGWDLLQRLKGRKEVYLPTIYDIEEEMEGGKKITYVFYEHITGNTLEQSIFAGGRISLRQTADHVLKALESIHALGFWFPDFCEKNIFCETGGRVVLVDLDSTVPLDMPPANDIYGSKDYWIPVYRFFKENLQQPGMMLDNLHGLSLNYLQSIFLVLHLKLYAGGMDPQYNSDESYNRLPEVLGRLCPSSLDLFRQVVQQSPQALSAQSLEGVKAIIKEIIDHDLKKTSNAKPDIQQFNSSTQWAGKGEPFTLSWKVMGANRLELYRNGVPIPGVDAAKNSIERKEFYDDDKEVRYQLYAYQNGTVSKSDEVVIRLQTPGVQPGIESPEIGYLRTIASWSMFITLSAFVILAIVFIIIFTVVRGSDLAGVIEMLTLLFLAMNIFPAVFLLRMSNLIKKGLQQSDIIQLNRGFKNLNNFFGFIAILIIIFMVIGLIAAFAAMLDS